MDDSIHHSLRLKMGGRDRTAEFVATIQSKREKPQWIQQRQVQMNNNRDQIKPSKLAMDPQYRKLMRVSHACSQKIKDSIEKLERFTLLARKRTVFDDGELNRLIAEIRQDIGETKSQLDYLKSECEPKQRHTENIVTILQRKLANVTSSFKSTLEMRSRSVQEQTARHEMFSDVVGSSSTSRYEIRSTGDNALVTIDMGASNSSSSSSQLQHRQLYNHQQQQQQQQLAVHDPIDLSERADKMQLIESTIVELGTVFNQLAHMVQAQGETITRIDMNISETTANVEAAHDALLRYFASINSNRWLILKVFGVLFFFFIIFVVFAS